MGQHSILYHMIWSGITLSSIPQEDSQVCMKKVIPLQPHLWLTKPQPVNSSAQCPQEIPRLQGAINKDNQSVIRVTNCDIPTSVTTQQVSVDRYLCYSFLLFNL